MNSGTIDIAELMVFAMDSAQLQSLNNLISDFANI
jgi:hypothetical protein